jgi:hypothetical protein
MAKRTTKSALNDTWSDIAKFEAGLIGTATKAVERVPSPADMLDSALVFAANTLKSQRKALVPLLKGVSPKGRKGEAILPSAADAVAAAYDLAERVVETQRKVLRGLVETVTPPLARHAERSHPATGVRRARPAQRKRTSARRTVRHAA